MKRLTKFVWKRSKKGGGKFRLRLVNQNVHLNEVKNISAGFRKIHSFWLKTEWVDYFLSVFLKWGQNSTYDNPNGMKNVKTYSAGRKSPPSRNPPNPLSRSWLMAWKRASRLEAPARSQKLQDFFDCVGCNGPYFKQCNEQLVKTFCNHNVFCWEISKNAEYTKWRGNPLCCPANKIEFLPQRKLNLM